MAVRKKAEPAPEPAAAEAPAEELEELRPTNVPKGLVCPSQHCPLHLDDPQAYAKP